MIMTTTTPCVGAGPLGRAQDAQRLLCAMHTGSGRHIEVGPIVSGFESLTLP